MLHQHYTEHLKKEIDFIKILVSRFHDQEQLTDIELDLVLTKVQLFYEQLLKLKLIHKQLIHKHQEQPEAKKTEPKAEVSSVVETPYNPVKQQEQTILREETPKVAATVHPSKKTETVAGTLADKIRPERYNPINESLVSSKTDLAGKLQAAPLHSISEGIGVNDRFLFIRELFDGSSDLYSETVRTLDTLQTLADALNFIEQRFNWDEKAESTRKFVRLVHRRHG
ncbi:MAG: hypothetical protein LBS09_05100 [Bacteroidales bacterium]|jgi:hypothetical protein|nr:hypothetical protein [Bacteroidales bacterium]